MPTPWEQVNYRTYFLIRLPVHEKAEFENAVELESSEKSSEKSVEKSVEKIVTLIKNDPNITQKELAKQTGLSRRGVEKNISILKKSGKIKRIGPAKGGHWEILEK